MSAALALPLTVTAMPAVEVGTPIKLEIFTRLDRLPSSYFLHLANDNRNAPMICDGDVVVVDQGGPTCGGWLPVESGLFVIEYRSAPTHAFERYPRVSRQIVQTHQGKRGGWYASPLRRGMVGNTVYCSDGPYNDECHLADHLIGKVVGLYAPSAAVREALQ